MRQTAEPVFGRLAFLLLLVDTLASASRLPRTIPSARDSGIFDNPPRFLGNIIIPLVLWFGCDQLLRWLYSRGREEKG